MDWVKIALFALATHNKVIQEQIKAHPNNEK